MIGIPIAMWINGKKNWTQILSVWVLTLILVSITAIGFWYYLPLTGQEYLYITIFKIGVYVFVLFGALTMWQKTSFSQATTIIILAASIDFIIASLLGSYLLTTGQFEDWVAWLPHLGMF